MYERAKRALAPTILWSISGLLRGKLLTPKTKNQLWQFAQSYVAYFGFKANARLVNGMTVHVSSAPRVEQEIFLFGEWEPLFTRYLQAIPHNDLIFLDVGANIGYFSLVASEIFGEVHSIEASPSTSQRLRGNIAKNGISNVVVHEVAVGPQQGVVDFYQDKRQSGAASVTKTEHSVFESQVQMIPLMSVLDSSQWSRVGFIKIDIEGCEDIALSSILEATDQLNERVEIFVEFDPQRQNTWPVIERFLASGFSAYIMQGPYDRRDYVESNRQTELEKVVGQPNFFCDLLLRRKTYLT